MVFVGGINLPKLVVVYDRVPPQVPSMVAQHKMQIVTWQVVEVFWKRHREHDLNRKATCYG